MLIFTSMKKILVFVFFLLLAGSGVAKGQAALLVLIFGEKAASENFYFSLKAGLNYSIINGYDEGDNRLGVNFGLINNIRINDKWFLTPEFNMLSGRGAKNIPYSGTGNPDMDDLLGEPTSTDRKLSYLDIPVLVRYNVSERFSISAGPQISILTGAADVYEFEPSGTANANFELNIEDELSKVDVGAVLDLTFVLAKPKKGKGVNLFLRYTQGFIDIAKENTAVKYTHSTIQMGAAFPFISVPKEEE